MRCEVPQSDLSALDWLSVEKSSRGENPQKLEADFELRHWKICTLSGEVRLLLLPGQCPIKTKKMLSEEEFEKYYADWATQEAENYRVVNHKSGTITKKYLKKDYDHFDNRFWFPERKGELKEILKNDLKVFSNKNNRWENWAFSPFIKVLIKTPRYKEQDDGSFDLETKIRPICYASHVDSLIFGFYSYVLTRKYEAYILKEGFNQCPIAYRSNLNGNCNIQFSKEVFDYIRFKGPCAAVALDITGYFDHIDHIILKEKWTKVHGDKLPDDQFRIFKNLTNYSYVKKDNILKKYNVNLKKLEKRPRTLLELVPGDRDYQKYDQLRADRLIVTNKKPNQKSGRICGIPQGSPMSSVLSNIYLQYSGNILSCSRAEI